MEPFFTSLGALFIALALLSLLGLLKPFARHIYPTRPGVVVRCAAPVLFACLAMACLCGAGMLALAGIVVAGVVLIAHNRRNPPCAERQRVRIPR